MRKSLLLALSLFGLLFFGGCGNDEAVKKYEQEKQKYEQMQEDNRREINRAIASGASKPEILMLKMDLAKQLETQAEIVDSLAKEAGVED